MNFEINHNADGLFENNNKNEAGSEAERTKQAKVIKDFENAFLASFAHYKENPQNRFPGTAHLLYAALYKPDEIQQIMSADAGVQEKELETRRQEINNISKYANLENVPTIEEFNLAFRQLLKHGTGVSIIDAESKKISHNKESWPSFEDTIYPDVPAAMRDLWDKYNAQIVIWTQGDKSSWKGQFYKVLNASRALRKDRASESRENIFSIVAENHKLDHLFDILRSLKKSGANKIILAEDRLENIKEGKTVAQTSGVSCIPVWVRREGNKAADDYIEKNIDETAKASYREEYNAVNSFTDVQKILEQKKLIEDGDKLGMVIDFDGVLSDNSLSNRVWANTIVNTLISNKWIKKL